VVFFLFQGNGNSYGAGSNGSQKRNGSSSRHYRGNHNRKAKQQATANLLPASNSLLPIGATNSYGQYGASGTESNNTPISSNANRLPQIGGASNAGGGQNGAESPRTLNNSQMLAPPLASRNTSNKSPNRRGQQQQQQAAANANSNVAASAASNGTHANAGGSNHAASAVQAVGGVSNFPMTAMELYPTCGVSSIKGLKPGNAHWINQDNFFIVNTMDSGTTASGVAASMVYCVLDGHGEHGHLVSRRCVERLPDYMTRTGTSSVPASGSPFDLKKAFLGMQAELQGNSTDYDARCSGATCVLVHVFNSANSPTKLVIANAGDSRAVLGRRATG
jgi:hypothetical protein